jgi:hypothetical protein
MDRSSQNIRRHGKLLDYSMFPTWLGSDWKALALLNC